MRVLEVSLNGKMCVAGLGDSGVLTAIVSWRFARGKRRSQDDLRLDVGGLNDLIAEHIDWQNRRLRAGDEVRIRVAEADKASRPRRRKRSDPAFVEKAEKKYVENAAKRLGWKLLKPEKARD